MVWIHSFCMSRSSDNHAWNTGADRNSSYTSVWTSLDHVNNIFIFLHISLYLTFSTVVYTWKGTSFLQMLVNTRLTGIRHWGYCNRYSSTAAVVLLLQTPYIKCISAYSSQENDMFTVTAHCTSITAQNDCSVCYLRHYWPCNMSTPT